MILNLLPFRSTLLQVATSCFPYTITSKILQILVFNRSGRQKRIEKRKISPEIITAAPFPICDEKAVFGSVEEPKKSLCPCVCLSVRPFGTKLSKGLNLHLRAVWVSLRSVSGQAQVRLRSGSGQSQVSLRSVSGQSQVCPRSVPGLS